MTRDEKRMHQLLPSKPGGSPITRGFSGLTTATQQCSGWPPFTPEKPGSLIRYGGPFDRHQLFSPVESCTHGPVLPGRYLMIRATETGARHKSKVPRTQHTQQAQVHALKLPPTGEAQQGAAEASPSSAVCPRALSLAAHLLPGG